MSTDGKFSDYVNNPMQDAQSGTDREQKQSHGLRFRYAKEVMTDGVRAKEASGDSH